MNEDELIEDNTSVLDASYDDEETVSTEEENTEETVKQSDEEIFTQMAAVAGINGKVPQITVIHTDHSCTAVQSPLYFLFVMGFHQC